MLQRIIMIVLILIIALGGGMYAYKQLIPPAQEETQATVYSTEEVVKGDISVGVETVGRLDPSNSGGLMVPGNRGVSNFQFIIDEFLVEEGDIVKKGDIVARLSSTQLENQLEEKKEELKNKREQLAEISQTPVDQVDNLNPSRGITITSPIEGSVTELDINEGSKVELGSIIARVVDNSKYIVEAQLFDKEVKMIEEGQKVLLTFPYFDGHYEGIVKKINNNRMPYKKGNSFAITFVYEVIIEAENVGLVQRDMDVRVGVRTENNQIYNFYNTAKVSKYIKEDKIMNTSVEAVVTDIHVDDMQKVKKGDPIITMSGVDVQDMLQEKINAIRDLTNEINQLSSLMNQTEIRAPMDGIVARFHRNVGESVRPGEWFGHLYTVSDMRMWTEVDDIDILNVKQGAPVKITVDALPNQSFEGKVENVSTTGEQKDGVSKFRVEIKVKGGKELRPGMQAKAYIDAGSAKDVLLVPLEAVFEEDGKTMVEVLKDNNITKVVPVKLGLMNDRFAEIKSGLKVGDKVVTGSTDDLLPSQHIKSKNGLVPDNGDKEDNNENNNQKE